MVVVKYNMNEIFNMLAFCSELGCDLKISDAARRNFQNQIWDNIHVSCDDINKAIRARANRSWEEAYSNRFGSPCNTFEIDDINVTLKTTEAGASYNLKGPCGSCQHFPCHEGLYFVSFLPDGSFTACQLNGYHITDVDDREIVLSEMLRVVLESEFIDRTTALTIKRKQTGIDTTL